jgi:hypothetical protein
MSPPLPTVSIQGQGVVPADLLNTFVQVCTNYSMMRTFSGLSDMAVFALGSVSPGDGGQALYYWNATSVATDNNSTVIVPSGNTQGAWLQLLLPPPTVPGFVTSGFLTGVSATTATVSNIASITLTAGTWMIWGTAVTVPAASTTTSAFIAAIAAGAASVTPVSQDVAVKTGAAAATIPLQVPVGMTIVTPTVSTPYYLNAEPTFAASTMTLSGILSAMQVLSPIT